MEEAGESYDTDDEMYTHDGVRYTKKVYKVMWNSLLRTFTGNNKNNDDGTSQIFMDTKNSDSDENSHENCDALAKAVNDHKSSPSSSAEKDKIDSLSLMIEKILNGKQQQHQQQHTLKIKETTSSVSSSESVEKCSTSSSTDEQSSTDSTPRRVLKTSRMKPLHSSSDENEYLDHITEDSVYESEYNDESSSSIADVGLVMHSNDDEEATSGSSLEQNDANFGHPHEFDEKARLSLGGTKESYSSREGCTYESLPEDNEDSAFLSGEDKIDKSFSHSSPQHSEGVFLTEERGDTVYFPHDDEDYDENDADKFRDVNEDDEYDNNGADGIVTNHDDDEDFVSSLDEDEEEEEEEEEEEYVSSISTNYSDDRFVSVEEELSSGQLNGVDEEGKTHEDCSDTFDNISIFTRDDIFRRENSIIEDSLASTKERQSSPMTHRLSPVAQSYENTTTTGSSGSSAEPTQIAQNLAVADVVRREKKSSISIQLKKDYTRSPSPLRKDFQSSPTLPQSTLRTPKTSTEKKAHINTLSLYLDDDASRNRVEKLTNVEGDETLSIAMETSLMSPTINLRDEIELAESHHVPKSATKSDESSEEDRRNLYTREEDSDEREERHREEAVFSDTEESSSGSGSTSTRTREKLAAAEAELQKRYSEKTSSWTRERLAEVERRLALSRLRTSTRTRERIAAAEAELELLNSSTTTKTKERLADVEAALRKEKQRGGMSVKTLEMFKKKQEALKMILKENSNVDVAFLVDCTGSMGKYIEKTKHNIDSIVDNIINTFQNKVRIAFVGYRDHSDGPMRIETLGFTEDVAEFKSFVTKVKATGGADAPEDVLGGLEAAINLSWSSKNRIIFHIADSPQHGARFHNMCPSRDNHYKIEPRGLKADDVLRDLKNTKLKYYFGKINSTTDKMIKEFKKIAGPNIIQVADMRNFNLLGMIVVDSITKTILGNLGKTMHTFKTTGFASCRSHLSGSTVADEDVKILKHYSISEVDPDYAEMKTVKKVKWLECHIPPISELAEIKTQISAINHKWTTATVKKANDPFSEGEQRISYHGVRIFDSPNNNSSSHTPNQDIVLKEFKHVGKGRDRREDYIGIMETQAIAAFMANAFNKISPSGSKEIQFLNVSVMQMCKSDGAPKYYNIEVLLPDYKKKFKKWNNNAGYVSDKIFSSTLDAFSHWTYDITDGFLIVVDLQGVDRDDRYVLTDPSINCKEPRFGLTNLGSVGIEMFFKYHSCGAVCQAMGLKKNKHMRNSTPARISAAITKLVGH